MIHFQNNLQFTDQLLSEKIVFLFPSLKMLWEIKLFFIQSSGHFNLSGAVVHHF